MSEINELTMTFNVYEWDLIIRLLHAEQSRILKDVEQNAKYPIYSKSFQDDDFNLIDDILCSISCEADFLLGN